MEKGDLKRQFFIAVFPPDHIKQQIAQQLKENAGEDFDHWEWKSDDDYHISLAFPGRLTEEELADLLKTLEQVDNETFEISLKGLQWFPREENKAKNNKHVLWASPDQNGNNSFRELHLKVKALMRRYGFKYGRDEVSPHITIAKTPISDVDLAKDFMNAHNDFGTDSWVCDRFAIYETLSPDDETHPKNNQGEGSRYRKIAEFRLK